MLQKLYTETRLVIADKFLIWKLLTSSSQLANWMPNVKSIEHLGNDSLCTGSLLWVEMWAGKESEIQMWTVEDFILQGKISFVTKIQNQKIKFTFAIENQIMNSCKITMTSECSRDKYKLFQKKKMSNIIIVSAWEYLDSLDFAITQHRKNN